MSKAKRLEEITFNAVTAISGARYQTMWRKVKAALSAEWAKELQKKLGKLQNRPSYVC